MQQSRSNHKGSGWAVVVLTLIPLLMVLGNSVLIPGLPTMQSKLHVSKLQISLLITLFSVPAGIVIPFAGMLSDRISRKWIVVPSLLLFGIGGVLAAFAAWKMSNPYMWVLAGRIVQGVGAAGTAPIAMAWVGDLFKGEQRSRVLGLNEAGNAFGKVISPIVGAAVLTWSWIAIFLIFPILCLPVAAGVMFLMPGKSKQKNQGQLNRYFSGLGQVFRQEGRWLSVVYLCGAVALFNLFGVLFFLSDLLESKYNIVDIPKGLVLAIPLLALTCTSLFTGWVIKKKKTLMKWLIVSGFIVLACSMVGDLWVYKTLWLLVASISLGACGAGLILPSLNMLITSAVKEDSRGAVTSLYGSVRFLGVAFGPPVYTWLLDISTSALFLSVAGLALVCTGLAWVLVKPAREDDGGSSPREAVRRLPARYKARA